MPNFDVFGLGSPLQHLPDGPLSLHFFRRCRQLSYQLYFPAALFFPLIARTSGVPTEGFHDNCWVSRMTAAGPVANFGAQACWFCPVRDATVVRWTVRDRTLKQALLALSASYHVVFPRLRLLLVEAALVLSLVARQRGRCAAAVRRPTERAAGKPPLWHRWEAPLLLSRIRDSPRANSLLYPRFGEGKAGCAFQGWDVDRCVAVADLLRSSRRQRPVRPVRP